MATIEDVRNPHQPLTLTYETNSEHRLQVELTPEALACLQDAGHLPDVDETLGLTRPEWKKSLQPESCGTTWGFGSRAQTIGKSKL
jgi:hypothetical protein